MLHRHALASKTLPDDLKNVMHAVTSAVNFIRSHALKIRLFKQLCKEMGAKYTHLSIIQKFAGFHVAKCSTGHLLLMNKLQFS